MMTYKNWRINGHKIFELNDKEVLFFIRIRGKKSYFENIYGDVFLSSFLNISQYRTIFEYSLVAVLFINLNATDRDYLTQKEFVHLNRLAPIDDIIKKCRGLRECSRTEAMQLISRCYIVLKQTFENEPDLKLIVTNCIDNFVMHMMVIIGRDAGVCFIPITGSFMSPDYSLMILDGTASVKRGVSSSEVKAVFEAITTKLQTSRKHNKIGKYLENIYNIFSKYYRYFVRYLIKYRLMGLISYENRFALECSGSGRLWSFLNFSFFENEVRKSDKLTIYIPLHWYPEATTDYWITDDYFLDYYPSLYGEINFLMAKGFNVVVKEHPHFGFQRPSHVYKKLNSLGVQIISPNVPVKEVFDAVDLVLVMNGSTAIEAAVYGKPVARLTNSYYEGHVKRFDYDTDFKKYTMTKGEASNLVEHALSLSFKNTPDQA